MKKINVTITGPESELKYQFPADKLDGEWVSFYTETYLFKLFGRRFFVKYDLWQIEFAHPRPGRPKKG